MIESILYRQSTIPLVVNIDGRSPCFALGIQRLTHRDANLLTRVDQVGVLDDFPVGVENPWVVLGISIVPFGNG